MWKIDNIRLNHIFEILSLMMCAISVSCISGNASFRLTGCNSVYDTVAIMNVYPFVDVMPVYSGGDIEVAKFFARNYIYPEQDSFQATFNFVLVIDTSGKVIAARIRNQIEKEQTLAEKEALRVLNLMPGWIPGMCNKEKVPVIINLSVRLN